MYYTCESYTNNDNDLKKLIHTFFFKLGLEDNYNIQNITELNNELSIIIVRVKLDDIYVDVYLTGIHDSSYNHLILEQIDPYNILSDKWQKLFKTKQMIRMPIQSLV